MLDGVRTESNGAVHFGFADNGFLVYITDAPHALESGRLIWVSRDGREQSPLATPELRTPEHVRLSPDGTRVALTVAGDVWVYDVAGRPPTRITTDGGSNALWTPEGRRILYTGSGGGVVSLPSDGSGGEPVGASPRGDFRPRGWSRDGSGVVAVHYDGPQRHIVQWSLAAPFTLEPLVRTPAYEGAYGAAVSPDARWLAYASNRDGNQEIFVEPYPGPAAARRVSPGGGSEPVWARDGKELYYLEGPRLMAVTVDPGNSFSFSRPVPLFHHGLGRGAEGEFRYDVAADGRFLMIQPTQVGSALAAPQIVLVQNWFEELKRAVPGR